MHHINIICIQRLDTSATKESDKYVLRAIKESDKGVPREDVH